MYSSEITTDPLDVGHANVTLLLTIETVTDMEIGAAIELTFPSSGEMSMDESTFSTPPKCKF
jgi:hypothetical protein